MLTFGVTAKTNPSYIVIPADRSRTTNLYVFNAADLTKSVSKITMPKENNGQYVIWGDSYSKSISMSSEKAYVIWHRSDGWAERNLGYYVFVLSKNGTATKSSFLGTGCDWTNSIIDQQNKKITALSFVNGWIQLFDISKNSFKTFKYPLKKNYWISMILSLNNDIVTVIVDKEGVDSYTKDAKVISINMGTKKILSTQSYTQYLTTHKDSIQYICPVLGNPCTLMINNKKVSSKNSSLYSSRYFTTIINNKLLWYGPTGYSFIDITNLFKK